MGEIIAAIPSGLRAGSLRIPYYEALNRFPGPEAILTQTLGNLPRALQNYADAMAEMICRGEDEDTPDEMSLSSMSGTDRSKEAAQFAAYKKRRRKRVKFIDLAMAEEDKVKDMVAAMERIDELENHIHGMLGYLEEMKKNIFSMFLEDAKEMFDPREDFEKNLED